jgi:serine/threonine protein kinase
MLLPTLDALAFLHRRHLVHGQLKPSNFLVVNDQLKLASDNVRPIGNSASGIVRTSSYDPPELKDGGVSTAGDIWGLGITLVEALTQRARALSDEQGEIPSLPASLPAPFLDTVRRCLSLNPANRPTVIELEAQYKPAPQAHSIPVPQPSAPEAPREAVPPQSLPQRRLLLSAIAAALVISLAVWVGLRFSGTSQAHLQTPGVPAPAPVAPSGIAKSAESDSATSPAVLHEVTPDVPRAIRDKIRGHVRVTVRVLVDPSGNVVGQFLENPGPSRYFARLAGDAAGEWKFAPADTQGSRVWLLRFEFHRGGVTVHATAAQ